MPRWSGVVCALGIALGAARPASAAPDPNLTSAMAIVPGLGHLMLGEPGPAAAYAGLTVGTAALGLLGAPPMVFADLPELRSSMWLLTAQEVWSVSIQQAYQEARVLGGDAPRHPVSPGSLALAPVSPEVLSDWRVWAAVALGTGMDWAFDQLMPNPQEEAPALTEAHGARLLGREVGVGPAYAAHVAGGAVIAAHAGIGEEAFFRAFLQEDLDRAVGPVPSLLVTSGLFGLAHVGGVNQISPWRQFGETALMGLLLGGLYDLADHDVTRSVAAHTWYDAIAIARMGVTPGVPGNNLFGLEYRF